MLFIVYTYDYFQYEKIETVVTYNTLYEWNVHVYTHRDMFKADNNKIRQSEKYSSLQCKATAVSFQLAFPQ